MAQIQKVKLKYHLAQHITWLQIPIPMSLLLQSHRVLDVQPQASQLLAFFFFFLMAYFPARMEVFGTSG